MDIANGPPRGTPGGERSAAASRELAETIDLFRFAQFVLDRQQRRLHEYARSKGVRLIGDVPFLLAPNSAEVGASRNLPA